jgi:hypothetical protein
MAFHFARGRIRKDFFVSVAMPRKGTADQGRKFDVSFASGLAAQRGPKIFTDALALWPLQINLRFSESLFPPKATGFIE